MTSLTNALAGKQAETHVETSAASGGAAKPGLTKPVPGAKPTA
jgi:hypothetical protein